MFGITILSMGRTAGAGANHAFHHNVLKELENKDNPLHEVMGRGEVNAALWKAKDLRNKWKEGGEEVPLGMYDLKWIVGRVLEGLEGGYVRAREWVELQGSAGGQQNGGGNGNGEESWGWMVGESMDLDDVE